MAVTIPEPVKTFLEKPNFAVLATHARSGRMQVTPVWFLHANGEIMINTSAGRAKLRNMEANPMVALAIVDRENPYRYVQIQGRVVRFDKEHGGQGIDTLAQRYTGKPYTYPGGDTPKTRVSIHIVPEHLTAQGL
jgi:PPOX class probable F420-dependent enzyme